MIDTTRVRAFFGLANHYAPTVSPSGDTVAFRRATGDDLSLHRLDVESGERMQLLSGLPPTHRSPLYWLPNGQHVVCVTGETNERHEMTLVSRDGDLTSIATLDGRGFPWATTDGTVWYWGETAETWTLYRHAIDGPRTTIMTVDSLVHRGGGINNGRVALNRVTNGTIAPSIIDAETGEESRIAADGWAVHTWRDPTTLLLTRPNSPGTGVYDLTTADFTWTEPSIDRPITALPSGDILAVSDWTLVCGGPHEWRGLPIDGAAVIAPLAGTELLLGPSRVVVPRKSPTQPRELVSIDLTNGTTATLASGSDERLAPTTFVAPESVTYPAPNGESIDAYLWTPESEPPFPAVVGGYPPKATPTPGLKSHIQLLIDAGYAVLWVGHRDDRREAHHDYAAAGQWLTEQATIIDECVAFYGHSAGGTAALHQAFQHPTVWTAVVAWAGVFDKVWAGESGTTTHTVATSDVPAYEDAPDVWQAESPATYAETLAVPLCALYGRHDSLVPLEHGRRLRNTVPTDAPLEYHEFNAGHGEDHETKVAVWLTVLAFLSRQMRAASVGSSPTTD